jgi:hypothetical protein
MSKNRKKEADAKPHGPAPVADQVFPRPQRAARYRVVEGKSITSGKGLRTEGQDVTADMLGGEEKGGQKALDSLIERGIVEKY